MTNTQVTLVQLDNYGPWTVTPHPRPEPDLQTLQARLFADVAQFVGSRDGYAFATRFDNMIAVTNGMSQHDHERLQRSIGNRYPITASLGIGTGETPVEALERATDGIQNAGSAQEAARTEVLAGEPLTDGGDAADVVEIAHFDVVDATGTYTDRLDAFDAHLAISRASTELADHLYRQAESLSFFVGGDNMIAVTAGLDRAAYRETIEAVRDRVGVELRVGVGTGHSAHLAGYDAKLALEDGRETETAVVFADA